MQNAMNKGKGGKEGEEQIVRGIKKKFGRRIRSVSRIRMR